MFKWISKLRSSSTPQCSILYQSSDGSEVEVSGRQGCNLLDILQRNGVSLYSVCGGGGICGQCRVRNLSGDLQSINPELEQRHLGSAVERNVRLACQTRVFSDVSVGEYLDAKEVLFEFQVVSVRNLTRSIFEVVLKKAQGSPTFSYRSGQHVSVLIPQYTNRSILGQSFSNAKETHRSYSIANSEEDFNKTELIRLNVRREDQGVGSGYLCSAQIGEPVSILRAFGNFCLPPPQVGSSKRADVVLIAGGVGLAPIMSLLEGKIKRGEQGRMTLFYAFRELSDAYDLDRLQEMQVQDPEFSFHLCPSRLEGGQKRRINAYLTEFYAHLSEKSGAFENFEFLICGPPPMVQGVQTLLSQWGISPQRIQTDTF
jgi:ferredoxin-NADP reductase/ferredoxin